MRTRIFLLIAMIVAPWISRAQDTLTLQQAIAYALANNYSVQIQLNQAEQAENMVHPGQAGLLPTINFAGSGGLGIQNTRLELAGQPDPIVKKGAQSSNYSAAVNVNYRLFSGMANSYRFDQLKINADLADHNTQVLIENTILQVVTTYFNVLRAQKNVAILEESLNVSAGNYELAKAKQALSGGSGLLTLNSEVNYQRDSLNLMNALNTLKEAQVSLNLVLGMEDLTAPVFVTNNNSSLAQISDYDAMHDKMMSNNHQLMAARLQNQVSLLNLMIAKASYMPTVDLKSSYAYTVNKNAGSFLLVSKNDGLSGGITVALPIYAGNTRKIAVQNADLQFENAELNSVNIEQTVESALIVAWDRYQLVKQTIALEEKSVLSAKKNLELSQERFKSGQINSTQLREAQLNYTVAQNSLINAVYNLRLAEAELLRLSGDLLQ